MNPNVPGLHGNLDPECRRYESWKPDLSVEDLHVGRSRTDKRR
jgi:hypothetical protein